MIVELTRDNPRLLELEAAYRASPYFATLLKGSAWESFERGINLQQFRGEAQYQTQLLFGATPERYRRTFDYVRTIDTEGYLERLGEDGAFGAITFEFDGCTVSRDLLDSITEIYFLKETMGLRDSSLVKALDIGGGYGRFAYRLTTALPGSLAYCVDAVPVSTFLCEHYLRYRDCAEYEAGAISLNLLGEANLTRTDLAVNIHSFSEMKLEAINFWLDTISDLNIPYLFVVPHDSRWVSVNPDGSHDSFKPLIERHGYKLEVERSKFPAGVDGIYSEAIYTLWRKG